ncbi:DUF6000 family protein [Streptomyces sp. Ru87]|uniref:DUF6000 family protein n=1 Tax=Streptomyces sp. Ru87 TaxID=2044307 RepID=UPI00117D6D9D|nr:DUF6000 family protein [Streptomyces sp. Ru87]
MILPNENPQILAPVRRYVMPDRRYMKLHGWNLENMEEGKRNRFVRSLARDSQRISDTELTLMFRSDWRPQLTASWLIATARRKNFRRLLEIILHTSTSPNTLKGTCFALTRFGSHEDAAVISEFLKAILTPGATASAQHWALSGLLHIDRNLESDYADAFLERSSMWSLWQGEPSLPPETRLIPRLLHFLDASTTSAGPVTTNREMLTAPEDLYTSWEPSPLPVHWEIVPSESSRRMLDESLISSKSGEDDYIASLEPLSVAQCKHCDLTLFNTAPGRGGWFTAHPNRGLDIADDAPRTDMCATYPDVAVSLMNHRH